eukprot:5361908-Pyramimonas_sp.AAC.1
MQALRQDGGMRCITAATAGQSIAPASAAWTPNQRWRRSCRRRWRRGSRGSERRYERRREE